MFIDYKMLFLIKFVCFDFMMNNFLFINLLFGKASTALFHVLLLVISQQSSTIQQLFGTHLRSFSM